MLFRSVSDNVIVINKRINNGFSAFLNKYKLELTFDIKFESNLSTSLKDDIFEMELSSKKC